MKIKFTRAPAIGRRRRSRPGSAAPLQGLVIIAGLLGAVAVGTATTASPAVKAAVSRSPRTSAVTAALVTASHPPAGSYSATNPQNNEPITFYVSSGQTSVQDISVPFVGLTCAPGGATVSEPIGIPAAPIKPDGSFTATTTQTGVYAGFPAKFTYTFRGNFHSVAPSGAARAAGTFQETLKYTDSTSRTCTSNAQSWTATRNA